MSDKKTDQEPHSFHIPVMGTSFSVDTPLKVARYGISSVVSIMDDLLAENMRKFYTSKEGEDFEAIPADAEDFRARRITAYLNMMRRQLTEQVKALQGSPFKKGSEITRYFEMLPDGSWLKKKYNEMLVVSDEAERKRHEDELRPLATPGRIDVNIMTKVDRDNYKGDEKLPQEFADAMSSLRGFAKSELESAIVFSAGLNPRLYAYVAKFEDFFASRESAFRKKIVLKVSDFRSALIQGKFFAKHGLWVSEYRVESGLNCGGHSFASSGQIMGPILEEFKKGREDLIEGTFKMFKRGLASLKMFVPDLPPEVKITVQGGIGTHEEDELLRAHYGVDRTGWGTPFMLVPEAVIVDDEHLEKLIKATDKDVELSKSSPFGIPFWTLRNSASETQKRERIDKGDPGAPCIRGLLRLNPEFPGKPLCAASKTFIRKKLAKIDEGGFSTEQQEKLKADVLEKACICVDLAGAAERKYGIDPDASPSYCPGPNIVNFDSTYSLEDMISHIYGRINLLKGKDRPHMFIKELMLSVELLKDELDRYKLDISAYKPKFFKEFRHGLLEGIEYYSKLAEEVVIAKKDRFLKDLASLKEQVDMLPQVEELSSAKGEA